MKMRAVVAILSLVILFLVNRFVGVKGGYYEKGRENFWFDKIMHFLGGFFTALFWSAFVWDWFFIILLTFLVGIFWEIGEYFYGIYKLKKSKTDKHMTHIKDTIEDLIFDVIGAGVLVVFLKLFL